LGDGGGGRRGQRAGGRWECRRFGRIRGRCEWISDCLGVLVGCATGFRGLGVEGFGGFRGLEALGEKREVDAG